MIVVSGASATGYTADVEVYSPGGNCKQTLAPLPVTTIDLFAGLLGTMIIACFGESFNKVSSDSKLY